MAYNMQKHWYGPDNEQMWVQDNKSEPSIM